MICFPNAKINIGLNVISKRPDGFHNLESVFYPISWKDALEALPAKRTEINFSGLSVPGNPSDNLVLKALTLLEQKSKQNLKANIHLHKVIPMGAGLGGGSADGAFALRLFNDLFELKIPLDELMELAAQLGSDCPFFVENRPVLAYDRGIFFREIDLSLNGYFIVCVNPGIHIGTAEAYSSIQPGKPSDMLADLIQLPVEQWEGRISNDFEKPMLQRYPLLRKVKDGLYELGAVYASMTGSGSTFYGLFKEEPNLTNEFETMTVWKGKLE